MPRSWQSKPSTEPDWRDVERLALRQALGDVENDDVAQLLQPDQMRERSADHATADQGDLRARHPFRAPSYL